MDIRWFWKWYEYIIPNGYVQYNETPVLVLQYFFVVQKIEITTTMGLGSLCKNTKSCPHSWRHSRPKRISMPIPKFETPLFADPGRKSTPFSNEFADFEVQLETPVKEKCDLFSLYKIIHPVYESHNNYYIKLKLFFYARRIFQYVWCMLKVGIHLYITPTTASMLWPNENFTDLCLKKITLFHNNANSRFALKNAPIFANMGTSMDDFVRVAGPVWYVNTYAFRFAGEVRKRCL